jgi:hypothetical protein
MYVPAHNIKGSLTLREKHTDLLSVLILFACQPN